MKIDILTLFPEMFDGFLNTSIIKRAIDGGYVEIKVHNFRDYSTDKEFYKVWRSGRTAWCIQG